jgi:hypothetical protein
MFDQILALKNDVRLEKQVTLTTQYRIKLTTPHLIILAIHSSICASTLGAQ